MGEFIDKAKGKAKQAEGEVTGNRTRKAEGVLDEAKGKLKGAFEEAKTNVKEATRKPQPNRDAHR